MIITKGYMVSKDFCKSKAKAKKYAIKAARQLEGYYKEPFAVVDGEKKYNTNCYNFEIMNKEAIWNYIYVSTDGTVKDGTDSFFWRIKDEK